MGSAEKNKDDPSASVAFPWLWDSRNHPRPSQWLQSTLSDLDQKTKVMLNLIQDDGDSFAKRAEMYYESRPELLKMLEDLHKSYHSLAEKYDQLRSESIHARHLISSSSSNSLKQVQLQNCDKANVESTKSDAPTCQPESVVEDPDPKIEIGNFESLNRIADELMHTDMTKNSKVEPLIDGYFNGGVMKKENGIVIDHKTGGDFQMGSLEREKMWNELRLKNSKLIEDNLCQQAELMKRNDEKREAIKDLCSQINKLMNENKALKSSLASHNMKQNQSKGSRLKGLFLGKFSG